MNPKEQSLKKLFDNILFKDVNVDYKIVGFDEIDGIENPIFKVLDPHDFELYKKDESMVDEMVFRNRLIELGLEYIKKDGKISAHFERISRNFVLAPQHFVRSTLTLRRLQQRRM